MDLAQEFLLNDGCLDPVQQHRRVCDSVFARIVVHHPPPQLLGLRVFGLLAFMREVRLSGDTVVCKLIWCLGHFRAELVSEAVGHVLGIAGVVPVDTHLTIKVERGNGIGHEGPVDGDLIDQCSDAAVCGWDQSPFL